MFYGIVRWQSHERQISLERERRNYITWQWGQTLARRPNCHHSERYRKRQLPKPPKHRDCPSYGIPRPLGISWLFTILRYISHSREHDHSFKLWLGSWRLKGERHLLWVIKGVWHRSGNFVCFHNDFQINGQEFLQMYPRWFLKSSY